jgi:trehalose 6-phosphate phosphatase
VAEPFQPHASAVARALLSAPSAALGLDLDGTLTEIVPEPDEVWLSPERRAILQDVVDRSALRVVVLSGRSRADAMQRLGVSGLSVVGNHGFELEGWRMKDAELTREALEGFLQALGPGDDLPFPVRVEDKGATATVHLRGTRADADRDTLLMALQSRLDDGRGDDARYPALLRLHPGKASVEIRPAVEWDKARALRMLLERWRIPAERTFYAGDDATDECVFADLHQGFTLKVGEGPTAARYRADASDELWEFLREIVPRRSGAENLPELGTPPPLRTPPELGTPPPLRTPPVPRSLPLFRTLPPDPRTRAGRPPLRRAPASDRRESRSRAPSCRFEPGSRAPALRAGAACPRSA